jgi:hypothetical protein
MAADQQRDCDVQNLKPAAEALGIDASALAFNSPKSEPEPEPLPELKIDPVSDEELAVLEPALLRYRRYLSKVPPRDFLSAALWLAAYRFEFNLLPLTGPWSSAAIRDKIARESRAGLWSALVSAAEQSGQFSEERLKLLDRLVSYEKAALARSERLRVGRLKELANEKAPLARAPS